MKKSQLRQGEIWLFDPDPVIGNELGKKIRPCLIISNNLLNNGNSGLLIIIPISSIFKGISSHIHIPKECGLKTISYVMCEQIRCISKERLVKKIGILESEHILKEIHSWIIDFIKIS